MSGAGAPVAGMLGTAGTAGVQAGTLAPPVSGSAGIAGSAGASGVGVAGTAGMSAGMAGTAGMSAGAGGQSGAAGSAGAAGTSEAGAGASGSAGQAGAAGSSSDTFMPCPPASEPCKILPFGDSITFGIGGDGGYRVELFRRALADGKNITFTGSVMNGPQTVEGEPFPRNNQGHSGWKIDMIAGLVPSPALDDMPHIVLLMIGTNDVAQNDDLPNAPERLGELIDKLATNAPDALIVVATILPLSFGSGGVMTYNAALPAIVEERAAAGVHVELVDAFEGFPTSELGDGVHPNSAGYDRLGGTFYEAIADVLP